MPDGSFKTFFRPQDANNGFDLSALRHTEQTNEEETVIICVLGGLSCLMLQRPRIMEEDAIAMTDTSEIVHFLLPDTTTYGSFWHAVEAPAALHLCIHRELGRVGANWQTLMRGPGAMSPRFMLEFSVPELISLCEMMAQKRLPFES
ncbi:uncharacterized protein AB675_10218 [Cyphellophora attinorum]|uniref:Uncharacterized protein n=1 Tax=Cyphellophora attinorum TaxID=1664694 RepID=A0A0N1NW18_9EURO|nr:uncharacterized protein AB675_10218 [Phialophora attinorum]KPI34783.1 hypothetical protein AB675_10218 [Phialophora attinorum]